MRSLVATVLVMVLLVVGIGGLANSRQASSQSDAASYQLLIDEVYSWCSTDSDTTFCSEGPGFDYMPGIENDRDRVHFQGPGVDFKCRKFEVPKGVTAIYWDGDSKHYLDADQLARTITACEAIFSLPD